MRTVSPSRRVADVAQWIRETLGYTPCPWLLMLEFRLGHDILLTARQPELDASRSRVRYGIFATRLEHWLMVEACRFVLQLWQRATDDTTAQALAAHLTGRVGHLSVVRAPQLQPAVPAAVARAASLLPVTPCRPTAPEAAPSTVRVLGLHRRPHRPPT